MPGSYADCVILANTVREANGGFDSQEKAKKKNLFLTTHWSKISLCCYNTAHT